MSNPNVSVLALTNGQELIAEVAVQVLTDPESGAQQEIVTLTNPCQIAKEFHEDGRVDVSFVPIASVCKDQQIQLSNLSVVWSAAPEDGFMEAYLRRFAKAPAILTPPEKKLIVPGQ
jgi:hypothetical protein